MNEFGSSEGLPTSYRRKRPERKTKSFSVWYLLDNDRKSDVSSLTRVLKVWMVFVFFKSDILNVYCKL